MGGRAQVPTLQSYALGVYNGLWVMVAGRTNGLHDFSSDGFLNFPPAYQNTFIWVVDPVERQTWSRSLEDPSAGLSTREVDSLSATNTESVQIGDRLYVAGGYVYDRTVDNFTTFDTLTALDLPGVIDWVQTGNGSLAQHLRHTSDPALKVAGGEMHVIDNHALLVFGQDFEGPYNPSSNGTYTRQVRVFDIVDNGVTLSINNLHASVPLPEYRRRDLNVVPMMQSNGSGFDEGLIALAGVFLPGPVGGAWTVPVEIDAAGVPSMADPQLASTFKQGMNTYRSATISLYSESRDETHIVALGGISLEYFDTATGQIAYDAGIPFINGITAIVRAADAAYTQYYLGEYPSIPNPSNGNAPFLFGSEANFIPAAGIQTYDNGMLKLDVLTQPTVIGYIHGGIIAAQANFGSSGASNLIFQVTYSPVTAPAPLPEIKVIGKNTRRTLSPSYPVKGTTANAARIEWQVNSRGESFHKQDVGANGKWRVALRGLRIGRNYLRVRAVSSAGAITAMQKITIIRR
jgi:hypothetical protein